VRCEWPVGPELPGDAPTHGHRVHSVVYVLRVWAALGDAVRLSDRELHPPRGWRYVHLAAIRLSRRTAGSAGL